MKHLPSDCATVTLEVPTGALEGVTNFSIILALDTSADPSEVPAGYSFFVRAWDTQGDQVTTFSKVLTLTVRYTDSVEANVREETLGLFWWDSTASEWRPLTTTVDVSSNSTAATLSHLSLFSLRGEPVHAAPVVTSVAPSRTSTLVSTPITITGSDFQTNSRVWLGQSILEVTYVNQGTLVAVVPAYLPVGRYSIEVVNPDYQKSELEDALEILPPLNVYLPLVMRVSISD